MDKSKAGDVEITPSQLEGFEELFDDWRLSGRNAYVLELGGTGDLSSSLKMDENV